MQLIELESSIAQNALILRIGVGVAGASAAQHDQRKSCGFRRTYTVLIGNELENHNPSTGLQGSMNFPKQSLIGRQVKMVQKIRDEDEIVILSKLHIESASRQQSVTIRNSRALGILFRNLEHLRPIEGNDLRLGIMFCNGDTKHAVA